MSTFENDQYRWRETYFVLFRSSKRPTIKRMGQVIQQLDSRFRISHTKADEQEQFDSLTVLAPDDFAALDVCYLEGEEVVEQASQWLNELTPTCCEEGDRSRIEELRWCDARFDLLHFEQITELEDSLDAEDEGDEMMNPSALLLVLDALVELTEGVGVDPQTGTFL